MSAVERDARATVAPVLAEVRHADFATRLSDAVARLTAALDAGATESDFAEAFVSCERSCEIFREAEALTRVVASAYQNALSTAREAGDA